MCNATGGDIGDMRCDCGDGGSRLDASTGCGSCLPRFVGFPSCTDCSVAEGYVKTVTGECVRPEGWCGDHGTAVYSGSGVLSCACVDGFGGSRCDVCAFCGADGACYDGPRPVDRHVPWCACNVTRRAVRAPWLAPSQNYLSPFRSTDKRDARPCLACEDGWTRGHGRPEELPCVPLNCSLDDAFLDVRLSSTFGCQCLVGHRWDAVLGRCDPSCDAAGGYLSISDDDRVCVPCPAGCAAGNCTWSAARNATVCVSNGTAVAAVDAAGGTLPVWSGPVVAGAESNWVEITRAVTQGRAPDVLRPLPVRSGDVGFFEEPVTVVTPPPTWVAQSMGITSLVLVLVAGFFAILRILWVQPGSRFLEWMVWA